ncbi:MAG: hypothetical protein GWO41_02095, partial [candidate division Zixibacteria bacterium]|nr:hypothetical protein [candidate division Zixibacteria bacterium]
MIIEVRDEVPEALETIVNRALAKEPNRRYQEIEELIVDLRNLSETKKLGAQNKRTDPTQKKPSRGRRLAISASVVLVLLAIIWGWLKFNSEPSDTTAPTSSTDIVVLPFSVHGASKFDYLGEGMVNLLSTKLDGAGELRSVDPRALLSFVNRRIEGVLSPEDGRRVAQHFDAGLFVMGDIVEAGRRLQINAALYEWGQGMKMVAEISTEGEAGQIFGIVDKLATQLLTRLTGKSGTRVTHLASMTTDSLPAIKAYL